MDKSHELSFSSNQSPNIVGANASIAPRSGGGQLRVGKKQSLQMQGQNKQLIQVVLGNKTNGNWMRQPNDISADMPANNSYHA